jgi:hypothetical protein
MILALCCVVAGVQQSINQLRKSLESDSSKVQSLLAEIRDKLGK